jgi:hypothetical protein
LISYFQLTKLSRFKKLGSVAYLVTLSEQTHQQINRAASKFRDEINSQLQQMSMAYFVAEREGERVLIRTTRA